MALTRASCHFSLDANWSMAAQSETTTPSKPSSSFRTSVSQRLFPCIFSPLTELKEAMTV